MTKETFISNQAALKNYANKLQLYSLAGFGIFILWDIFAEKMHWRYFLLSFFYFIFLIGGGLYVVRLGMRRQKQLGSCPKCQNFFHGSTADVVMSTGKCWNCGEIIITQAD
jgi:hypothetical protein